MECRLFTVGLIIQIVLLIYIDQTESTWLSDAMRSESKGLALRALEKKRLLNELEVEDEEELEQDLELEEEQDLEQERELEFEKEEEMLRRAEEEELFEKLQRLVAEERKREIRQTPVPAIRRLKMTPPPNVPGPILRLDQTPVPPSGIQRRPTPKPGEYPYNLAEGPLRQTPRPLRLTPVPPNKPPVYPDEIVDDPNRRPLKLTPVPEGKLRATPVPIELNWEEKMWEKLMARRAEAELERDEERERRYLMSNYDDYKK